MEQKPSHRPHKLLVLSAGVIMVLVLLAASYVYLWKVPDAEYVAVIHKISDMETVSTRVDAALNQALTSSVITDDTVSQLETVSSRYNDDYTAVTNSPVVKRDAKVRASLDQNKQKIVDYGTSLQTLLDSLKKYRAIPNACTAMVKAIDDSSADKNSALKGCDEAITAARSAGYAKLNDQFLTDYNSLSSDLLGAYRQKMITTNSSAQAVATNSIEAITQKIRVLGQRQLSLLPSPDPTNALKTVAGTVDSQKNTFIR